MKCDYCGKEFIRYDLKPVLAYRKTKYICYKCRQDGDKELYKSKWTAVHKNNMFGEKKK